MVIVINESQSLYERSTGGFWSTPKPGIVRVEVDDGADKSVTGDLGCRPPYWMSESRSGEQ